MIDYTELPSNCTLRSARIKDRWKIILLVFYLQREIPVTYIIYVRLFFIIILVGLLLSIVDPLHLYWYLFLSVVSVVLIIYLPLRNAIKNWSDFWLIECDRQIVACASISDHSIYSSVNDLYVSKFWRKKGLGTLLIKHCLKQTNKKVILWCSPKLINFYTSFGFEIPQLDKLPSNLHKNGLNAQKQGFELMINLNQHE